MLTTLWRHLQRTPYPAFDMLLPFCGSNTDAVDDVVDVEVHHRSERLPQSELTTLFQRRRTFFSVKILSTLSIIFGEEFRPLDSSVVDLLLFRLLLMLLFRLLFRLLFKLLRRIELRVGRTTGILDFDEMAFSIFLILTKNYNFDIQLLQHFLNEKTTKRWIDCDWAIHRCVFALLSAPHTTFLRRVRW